MMPQEWNITIETCLNVERQHVERLLPIVSQWIIDVKDMNREIYKAYTGKSNKRTIDNLRWMLRHEGMAERIILRLPHIPEYNTDEDVKQSRQLLKNMGIKTFDEFNYIVKAPS